MFKMSENSSVLLPKLVKIDAFPAPEKQKTLENASPEANFEKTTMKPKHIDLEAILEPFWVTWEAYGGLPRHLGANLSQHKPILSHLGANLRPP